MTYNQNTTQVYCMSKLLNFIHWQASIYPLSITLSKYSTDGTFFFVLIIDGYSYAKYLSGSECGGKRDILRHGWNPGWLTDHSRLWVWPSLYHLPHQTEGLWDILALKRK